MKSVRFRVFVITKCTGCGEVLRTFFPHWRCTSVYITRCNHNLCYFCNEKDSWWVYEEKAKYVDKEMLEKTSEVKDESMRSNSSAIEHRMQEYKRFSEQVKTVLIY